MRLIKFRAWDMGNKNMMDDEAIMGDLILYRP